MKNIETKNRISSIYPSPNPNSPTAEDVFKQELQMEIKRVEKQLDEEFFFDQIPSVPDEKSHFAETKKLKMTLNKLVCDNKVKMGKLENLKNLASARKRELEHPLAVFQLSEALEKVQILKEKVESTEKEIKKQAGEQEILLEMKNKAANEIIIFKERLLKELNSMEKLQNETSKKQIFTYLVKLQNSSAQQTLLESKKSFLRSQESFEEGFSLLQRTKHEQEVEIKNCVEKISKANIKSRENLMKMSKIQQSLEEYSIQTFDKSSRIHKSHLKIMEIRQQLDLIQVYCSDCPKFSEPLSKRDIEFIIKAYSTLKFQEHSLSLKFENLTEEQQDKQKKCDVIHAELKKIKEDEELENKLGKTHNLTFNEIKSLLDDQKIIEKTQTFELTQRWLLKAYLKMLSLAGFITNNLETISLYSKFHIREHSLLLALDEIKSLLKSPKSSSTGLLLKRKLTKGIEKKKTFKTELDSLEDVQTAKLNLRRIKDFLRKFVDLLVDKQKFGGEKISFDLVDLNECAVMISHDALLCFFIEIQDFDSKLLEEMSNSFRLVTGVHKAGTQMYLKRFQTLNRALNEIILWVRGKGNELKKEFGDKSDFSLIEKMENKVPFKGLIKYLLENSEKFEAKRKKRVSEESISHGFSVKSNSEQQSVKSRTDLPTADKTSREHQSFNFNLACVHSLSDKKSFENRMKSYSVRNLGIEKRVSTCSPSYNSIGISLRSSFRKK